MDLEEGAKIPAIRLSPDKFSGHVMVITGAAQGIGAETAQVFATQGALVVLLDILQEPLDRVQALIKANGGKSSCKMCDIGDEASVNETIDWIVSAFGKIDVLVNLAGVYPTVPLIDFPTSIYRSIMRVNVDGSFFLTRAVLPHMQKAGYGRIIHTSSTSVQVALQGHTPYVTSKMAVIGLVRSAAAEAGAGVTVNAIMPGLTKCENVWSQTVRPDGSNPHFEAVLEKQIVKRVGHPGDIAHAISFIASPEAQFFTGQIFDCGGGATFH